MGTQSGYSASTKPVEVIAPHWTKLMAPASGQIHKVELSQRNGKTRSVAIEIESGSRNFRIRARDNSRPRPVVARGLNLSCPRDITSKDEALKYLMNYPEKFVLFEGVVEEMKDGYWMGELTVDHVKRQTINKTYPFGTLGHALRWYVNQELGSENQKALYQKDAFRLLAMQRPGEEIFGHIPAEDLDEEIAGFMTAEWVGTGKAWTTLRGAYALLSKSLSSAERYPKSTGVRRGQFWGAVDKEGRGNPINNERKRVDKVIADNRLHDDECRPQPFTVEESRALIKVFKTQDRLKPYFPLLALLLSTGSRPNEIRALKWTHVLGLWQGHQIGTQVPAASNPVLEGRPVFMEYAVNDRYRTHIDTNKRFKRVKNGTSHQPELNRFIPGEENLFEQAINACLPNRNLGLCLSGLEWRKRLVYQGPGATDDFQLPFDWHNFRRYFILACAYAGVKYRRPYNLRHTYVSQMVCLGEYSCRQVASWIGDTENTMRARYLGYINFPMQDKVEATNDISTVIASMTPAEKAQLMATLANSMTGGA